MKKLLLFAAVAAMSMSANADVFSETFKVSCGDKTYASGETITVGEYEDPYAEIMPGIAYKAVAHVIATNISEEPWLLRLEMNRVSPAIGEYPVKDTAIGWHQLCYGFGAGSAGSCLSTDSETGLVSSEISKEVESGTVLSIDVDQNDFSDPSIPVTYKLDIIMTEGGEDVDGGSATFMINFTHTSLAGASVEGIEIDSADAEYYNMQGVRVANPEKGGMYIVRQGNRAVKRVF